MQASAVARPSDGKLGDLRPSWKGGERAVIVEIKFLGIRIVLAPETVEALLDFTAAMLGWSSCDEESASSVKVLD